MNRLIRRHAMHLIMLFALHASSLIIAQEQGVPMINYYKDKKVLVTGGCGFIGSHIAQKLVELGAHVTILDNLSTGFLDNIDLLKNKITLIINTITDQEACYRAVKGQDIIFHLAAFISVPQSVEEPLACHETNINGTLYLLEAAKSHGVSRFIFSSSSAVYGTTYAIAQETDFCAPTSPYGMSKLVGELYCQQYARHYGIKTVCLRYFNVYGERQNPLAPYAAAVATFKHKLSNNLPITIFGDGTQTRDFIHVSKVVEANLLSGMFSDASMNGQAFNIATGNSITILELLDTLQKDYPHYTNTISFADPRPGDTLHSAANCTKYKTTIRQFP